MLSAPCGIPLGHAGGSVEANIAAAYALINLQINGGHQPLGMPISAFSEHRLHIYSCVSWLLKALNCWRTSSIHMSKILQRVIQPI